MTRDDIIRMAREAGLTVGPSRDGPDDVWGVGENLERFATLVAAHEREKVAQWIMAQGYATGHGDPIEDLLTELEWQVREREREANIKIIEEYRIPVGNSSAGEMACEWTYDALKEIRDEIRARGKA
jgi:hypothetical protein